MKRSLFALTAALLLAGCKEFVTQVSTPTGLSYEVEASGDPAAPAGVLLRWSGVNDADLASYRVYSRGDNTSPFGLRGTTTSTV